MQPFDVMHGWLAEDYPDHAEILLRLSTDENERQPLLFDQVAVAIDFFRPNSQYISSESLENLHAGYAYLAAGLFCLDAVLDGHPRGESNSDISSNEVVRATVLFFTGALVRISRAFSASRFGALDNLAEFQQCIAENMTALRDELTFQSQPLSPQVHGEYKNITGRANIFPLLFSLCAKISGETCPPSLTKTINDFLFYLQLGDDVGDWREDFLAGRFTSFLRECFQVLGCIPDLDRLEEFVYLSGAYERRLAFIVDGLQKVKIEVQKITMDGTQFLRYVEAQLELSLQGIKDFVACKKAFCENESIG